MLKFDFFQHVSNSSYRFHVRSQIYLFRLHYHKHLLHGWAIFSIITSVFSNDIVHVHIAFQPYVLEMKLICFEAIPLYSGMIHVFNNVRFHVSIKNLH